MRRILMVPMMIAISFASPVAQAADFSDPTWPCIQRKVETLSLGQMFPHGIPPMTTSNPELETRIAALSAKLSLRRYSEEQAGILIGEFARTEPGNPGLGLVMQTVFENISRQRNDIINGIARYAVKQSLLSEQIEQRRSEMKTLIAANPPDFDRIDAVEEKLDWDERIYQDRTRALSYVCESPVLLEKRAFAISRFILKHWES